MTRNFIAAFLFLLSITPAATAQDTVKIKHLHQLLDAMGVLRMGPQMLKGIISQMNSAYPKADSAFWDEYLKEIDFQPLVDKVIPIYDKNFSDEDILQLLAFYQSPVGKKFVEKIPVITQEALQAGMEWGKEMSEKILEKLEEKRHMKSS
jgi:hypothetical protein